MTGTRERVNFYYNVNLGKISLSLGKTEPENMNGVTKRTNKNGEDVFEIISDYIAGKLVHAELKQPKEGQEDFGAQMAFTLEGDDGTKAVVNCKFDSAYGRGFLYASPNINLDLPLELEPYQYYSKKKGKDVSGLNIIQEGTKLDWAFGTKAKPGGMPELKKVKFKGKDTWDNTAQLEFLTAKFEEFCKAVNANVPAEQPAQAEAIEDEDTF